FLVALPSPDGTLGHHYGVTNYHVAVSRGFSCVRINTVHYGTEVFEFDPSDWRFWPGGDDLAIVPIDVGDPDHVATFIGHSLLLSPEIAIGKRIGPGDDVFMIGRFIDIEAKEVNVPAARCGNISTVPVRVKQPNGHTGDCYIVDMHSRTG